MKRLNFFRNSLTLGILMFGFLSCKDEDHAPLNEDLSVKLEFSLDTYEGQVAYTEYHLSVLAHSVAFLAKNTAFKEELYSLLNVKHKNNSETSVLIEALSNLSDPKSNLYSTELLESSESDYQNFLKSLDAFKDVTDQPLYPQLYIPFYSEHQKSGNRSAGQLASGVPVIVIAPVDTGEDDAMYTGYQLDENGELVALDFLISEDYAKNNEVWIFSISESSSIDDQVTVAESNTRTLQAYNDARINDMQITCHKEDWAYGKSEVHIISIFSNYNYSNVEVKLYGGSTYQGGKIRDFSRSEVNNEDWKTVNFYVLNDWDFRADPGQDYANYVIFEYDPWPASKRTANFSLNGNSLHRDYRSSNSSYRVTTMFKWDFAGHHHYGSCDEYTTEYTDSI